MRSLNGTLVVNTGAVGLPFDGDTRAGYAQLTRRRGVWRAELIRLAYERRRAGRDFYETRFIAEATALAPLILVELRMARSQLFEWMRRYEARVLAGEMTMEESAWEFLG